MAPKVEWKVPSSVISRITDRPAGRFTGSVASQGHHPAGGGNRRHVMPYLFAGIDEFRLHPAGVIHVGMIHIEPRADMIPEGSLFIVFTLQNPYAGVFRQPDNGLPADSPPKGDIFVVDIPEANRPGKGLPQTCRQQHRCQEDHHCFFHFSFPFLQTSVPPTVLYHFSSRRQGTVLDPSPVSLFPVTR